MGNIRFIHTADLHLGSPFSGMKGLKKDQWQWVKDSTYAAFDRLIDYAIKEMPDFVLIAGDIYDGEDRNIRAQHRFQQGMERLADAGVPVVLGYGNHDHLSGQWVRFELPGNVHVFGPEVSQKRLATQNGEVIISGFSYGERHVKRAMIHDFPPAEESGAFHIGMLHGSMDGETAHAVYAPFTKQQLLEKNYDYWALGHIHMREELHQNPSIVYPGNIQGRHKNEAGAKGFYDVSLSKSGTSLQFIPVSAVQFDRLSIGCEGIMHMNELIDACRNGVEHQLMEYGPSILQLHLTHLDAGTKELFEEVTEKELMETLQEALEELEAFVWISSIETELGADAFEISPLAEKIIGVMDSWQLADWKNVLKDLYRHPKGSRFLDSLNDHETAAIQAAAIQKIRRNVRMEE
ncbi:DNA repair exonuclease [Planococcus sp. NCCP-2050]|uniref:metallophosphoesterase family protein n=1 Tax=Planococcus sp. NCCP-2050 TaxID=2944679 RepID=UPI00203EF865|nr:DNA repair exonuclease [Planococcus sp. NCCP-2050]GKW47766.1 DNA repair exonuclease [Planococcus sp. NCCP-2050]